MDHGIMQHPNTDIIRRPLIISYSYAGHTHRIAQAIRALTGGDWCEIYPWQPYPMAFPELLAQVRKEVQTGYHPRLLPGFCSPKRYPVIFAGSPNWCGKRFGTGWSKMNWKQRQPYMQADSCKKNRRKRRKQHAYQ